MTACIVYQPGSGREPASKCRRKASRRRVPTIPCLPPGRHGRLTARAPIPFFVTSGRVPPVAGPAMRRLAVGCQPQPSPGKNLFESLRDSLRDLWHGSRTPEERRAVLGQMRDTLVQLRVGVEDLQIGLSRTRHRLAEERRELDTVRRRRMLAEGIGDAETVAVAARFEAQHAERVEVLERKLAVQEEELVLVEREVAEMTAEFKAAHAGVGPARTGDGSGAAGDAARAAAAEAEVESTLGERDDLDAELDALRRRGNRAARDARADAMLEELKRRMGQ